MNSIGRVFVETNRLHRFNEAEPDIVVFPHPCSYSIVMYFR
jgi:hypothetical protein